MYRKIHTMEKAAAVSICLFFLLAIPLHSGFIAIGLAGGQNDHHRGDGDVIHVDFTNGDDDTGDGTSGNPYKSIQKGVDEADYNDIVEVHPGTYHENIRINTTLTLRSSSGDPEDTIIKAGSPDDHAVNIMKPNVNVNGFRIENATNSWKAGVYLGGSFSNISGNVITGNTIGVYIVQGQGNVVYDNTVTNNLEFGVYITASIENELDLNDMAGNLYDLYVHGTELAQYVHDINTSNTIDNKPVYYLVDQKDEQIPADAGYVGIVNSSGITVSDQTLIGTGLGILMAYSTNCQVQDVNVSENADGIYLWHSNSNTFRNVISNSNGWDGIEFQDGSFGNTITGCTVNGNDDVGIEVVNSAENILENNAVNGNGRAGIHLYDQSNENEILGNSVNENGRGIFVYKFENNLIDDNSVISNDEYGIWLSVDCHQNTITNNQVLYSDHGLYVYSSSGNVIRHNTVSRNYYEGIYITESPLTIVDKNIASDNGENGVHLYDASNDGEITNNTFERNAFSGIYVTSDSDDNIIAHNMVTDSGFYGIDIRWSIDNVIYDNNFRNADNVYATSPNIWNISKTAGTNIVGGPNLGGNYWSDYEGTDPDRDGLGATAYDIYDTSEKDDLPLVPNEPPTIRYTQSVDHLKVNQTIEFNASGSDDPETSIASYFWDFGDGTNSSDMTVTHQYDSEGTYPLSLTLTDTDGAENTTSWEITVYEVIPPFIIEFSPETVLTDQLDESRTFMIKADQMVNVTWLVDGEAVQVNESAMQAWYVNLSSAGGVWNITANATNENGTAYQTWTWYVVDFTIEPAGQFGGFSGCIAVSGDYVYQGQGYGFNVIDHIGEEPEKIGSLTLASDPLDIYVAGNYAYVADSDAGLQIVDISIPDHPQLTGSYVLDDDVAVGVHVSGDIIYLAYGENGVRILDTSSRSDPSEMAHIDLEATDVFIVGDTLYVLEYISFTETKLRIYDVTDPEKPEEKGSLDVNGNSRVFVIGGHAYIACGWENGLDIIDVSDPESPTRDTYWGEDDKSALDVVVTGDNAYLAGSTDGFMILDVSDPSAPQEIGSDTTAQPMALAVEGNNAFLASMEDRFFQKMDITDGTDPEIVNFLEEPPMLNGVHATPEYLFVSSNDAIWVYNNTDTTNPAYLGRITGIPMVHTLHYHRDNLYAVNNTSLFIIDISDPGNLEVIGTYTPPWTPGKIIFLGRNAYLISSSRLYVLDISDPTGPEEVSAFDLAGDGFDLQVRSGSTLAYVVYYDGYDDHGLQIVNFTDLSRPKELGTIHTVSEPTCVEVLGNTAFVGSNTGDWGDYTYHLEAFDISDPWSPVFITETTGSGQIQDIEIEDGIILADVVGGSVHTWYFIDEYGRFNTGPKCPTPHGSMYSRMSSTPSSGGSTVYTSESSYGLVYQKITKTPKVYSLVTKVSPAEAASDGCTASPPSMIGDYKSKIVVQANAVEDWKFDYWSGAASGGNPKSEATITGNPSIAIAHFVKEPILTLGGGSGIQHRCPKENNTNVTIISITLSVNNLDTWRVYSVTFLTNGSGNEKEDLKEARLYLNKVGGTPLDRGTFGGDDASISFNTKSTTIPAGGRITLIMVYEFNDVNVSAGIKNFSAKINIVRVNAKPITYQNFLKLPDPKIYMVGGPVVFAPVLNKNQNTFFMKIQEAIDDGLTLDGHTIEVCPGTYIENVYVTKSLFIHFKGGRNVTFVQAKTENDHAFIFGKDNSGIKGFTIKGASAEEKAGIYMQGDFGYISDCKIENNYHGIRLSDAVDNILAGLYIYENKGNGIHIEGSSKKNKIGPDEYLGHRNLIYSNAMSGIAIEDSGTSDNHIFGNHIGTDMQGKKAFGNKLHGIYLSGKAQHNIIGGNKTGERNLISGNNLSGITIKGPETGYTKIIGNYIGTVIDTWGALPNGNGIVLTDAHYVTIGGTIPEDRNIISGNTNGMGIIVEGKETDGNEITGNYIGARRSGEDSEENKGGILVRDHVQYLEIGGTAKGEGNLIYGNKHFGINLTGSETTKNTVVGNEIYGNTIGIMLFDGASDNTIGGPLAGRNIIGSHRELIDDYSGYCGGIVITGRNTEENTVIGNYIGLNFSGTNTRPNKVGVKIMNGANNNTIGGKNTEQINMISGNDRGIVITGKGSESNVVKGNWIGLSISGDRSEGNHDGIVIEYGASENVIGGKEDGEKNVISGNHMGDGIRISGVKTTHNKVLGNYIGTDIHGDFKVPNKNGVKILSGADNNTIGGIESGERNVISGNEKYGVIVTKYIVADSKINHDNKIIGNYIGISSTGASAISNEYGIGIDNNAVRTIIGGSSKEERNIISGNTKAGIYLSSTHQTKILGNYIGLDTEGKSGIANGKGVHLGSYTSNNTIGGSNPGEGNVISGNKDIGIHLEYLYTENNRIYGNLIGIDATGVHAEANKHGIWIENNVSNTYIGGLLPGMGNHISGNTETGIGIGEKYGDSFVRNTKIVGNHIGLAVDHKTRIPNKIGIWLSKYDDSLIRFNRIWYNGVGIKGCGKHTVLQVNSIRYNTNNTGIHLDGSNPSIIGNTITHDAGDGILCENGSHPLIRYNNIHSSNGSDLKNMDPSVTIDASYNWWGSPDGDGAKISGQVNSDNKLPGEVTVGSESLSGTETLFFLDGSVKADFTVTSPTELMVLSFAGNPAGPLPQGGIRGDSSLDLFLMFMVDDPENITDLTLTMFYTEDQIQGIDENTLKPFWWDDTDWQVFTDPVMNTDDSDDFAGSVTVTIGSGTTPGTSALDELLIGFSGEEAEVVDHTISIIIDPISEEIVPGSGITVAGTVSIEPDAQVTGITLLLDGEEVTTIDPSGNSFSVTFLLPADLASGTHIICVNVTIGTGETAKEELIITYEKETDDDDIGAALIFAIVFILVLAFLVYIAWKYEIIPMGRSQVSQAEEEGKNESGTKKNETSDGKPLSETKEKNGKPISKIEKTDQDTTLKTGANDEPSSPGTGEIGETGSATEEKPEDK